MMASLGNFETLGEIDASQNAQNGKYEKIKMAQNRRFLSTHQYEHNFSFQSHRLLFSHASAEVRSENTPERRVASTGDRTHNHQVMSPTRSPLSHPDGTVLIQGLSL